MVNEMKIPGSNQKWDFRVFLWICSGNPYSAHQGVILFGQGSTKTWKTRMLTMLRKRIRSNFNFSGSINVQSNLVIHTGTCLQLFGNWRPLVEWFSTFDAWRPTKGYWKNFGGPPNTLLTFLVSLRSVIKLKLTYFVVPWYFCSWQADF